MVIEKIRFSIFIACSLIVAGKGASAETDTNAASTRSVRAVEAAVAACAAKGTV